MALRHPPSERMEPGKPNALEADLELSDQGVGPDLGRAGSAAHAVQEQAHAVRDHLDDGADRGGADPPRVAEGGALEVLLAPDELNLRNDPVEREHVPAVV